VPQPSRRNRRLMMLSGSRLLRIDSASRIAFMDLNSFTRDARLRRFFKRSFRRLEQHNIQHLVIDLRGNGGGSVTNSNLLTKYIATKPFRIADSLFAVSRNSRYGQYQQYRLWNFLFLHLMTRKMADGNYHFRYFEKKYFRPKSKNHFDGQVYILTGGNTFSASTLFIQSIRRQPNVVVVGEETGGGAYGNNAWLIPDVTLPVTGVRFRLPLFRLVIDKDAVKGRGVPPAVSSVPTVDAIRRNVDFKTEKVMELIRARQQNLTSRETERGNDQ
jgi:C-terminal processing protease CtpA/Prc